MLQTRKNLKMVMMILVFIMLCVLFLSGCDELSKLKVDNIEREATRIEYYIFEIESYAHEAFNGRTVVQTTIHVAVPPLIINWRELVGLDCVPQITTYYTYYDLYILTKNIILDYIAVTDVNAIRVAVYWEDDIGRTQQPTHLMIFAPRGSFVHGFEAETGDYETFEFQFASI